MCVWGGRGLGGGRVEWGKAYAFKNEKYSLQP